MYRNLYVQTNRKNLDVTRMAVVWMRKKKEESESEEGPG